MGAEELFKRFLMTSDARRCPNKKCSAIIQKNGGCNKVLCSMCKMSICWKCMKYFQQQHEAYDHLNDKHGGYFDN
jgi:ariadne-1